MKYFLLCFALGFFFFLSGWFFNTMSQNFHLISPVSNIQNTPTPKPLEPFTFESLKNRAYSDGSISINSQPLNTSGGFLSYIFSFLSDGKKVSGLMHVPYRSGSFPVIVMFRGYVPLEIYEPGIGTKHSAEIFAQNGFITLAPDFLGYGQSASPSAIPIGERFETYTTALNLLASIPNLNTALATINSNRTIAMTDKIGIWGHSNGGQIALSVLEITHTSYPTILWAPVSKPFPYSILYFTDDIDDHGKALRKVVADFEKDYDAEKYSLTNFLDWIQSPIQLHQGGADEAVPLQWSINLDNELTKLHKDITFFTYPGDDHNFAQGSWNTVVKRNIEFFKEKLFM